MRDVISLLLCLGSMIIGQHTFASVQQEEGPSIKLCPNCDELKTHIPESEQPQQSPLDLRRGNILLGFGIPLTAIGSLTTIGAGIVMIGMAVDDHGHEGEYIIGPEIFYIITGIVAAIGIILLAVGIPLWVAGHKKRKRARSKRAVLSTVSFGKGGHYNSRLMRVGISF